MNAQAATTYAETLTNKWARAFAHGLIGYYLHYGTPRQAHFPWPARFESQIANSTRVRVSDTIRHYMVGDCDIKGRLYA